MSQLRSVAIETFSSREEAATQRGSRDGPHPRSPLDSPIGSRRSQASCIDLETNLPSRGWEPKRACPSSCTHTLAAPPHRHSREDERSRTVFGVLEDVAELGTLDPMTGSGSIGRCRSPRATASRPSSRPSRRSSKRPTFEGGRVCRKPDTKSAREMAIL